MKLTVEVGVKPVPAMVRVTAGPPTTCVLGESVAITGVTTTVKLVLLVAVPPGVVTAIRPLVAPAGTAKVMVVALTTVKPVMATPFSVRTVAPVRFVPVRVTVVPTGPVAGVKPAMVGAGRKVKAVALVAVPPAVVTAMVPEAADAGTTKVMVVAFTTVKPVMATPFNVTAVAPVKLVPVMVTVAPLAPLAGVKPAMVGAGRKVKAVALVAVPPAVVTAIGPEVAVAGTVNVMVVPFTTVKPVMATPFNVTAVAPVKLVPVMVTIVPTGPLPGVKLAMVGAGTVTVKVLAAEAPPLAAGFITVTL